jgi:hypothetical protein
MSKKYKPIICLDFDGVLHSYTSGWQGARLIPDAPVDGAIDFIENMLHAGWDVAIHSSRSRHFGGIRAMRAWLKHHSGSAWWETMSGPGIEDARFVWFKPPALVTLDDRAMTFTGVFPSIDVLRNFKPWNRK